MILSGTRLVRNRYPARGSAPGARGRSGGGATRRACGATRLWPGGSRRRGGWQRRRAVARDQGSSAVELAILAPTLLLIIWLSVQFAFWYQGRQVALAAAQAGDRVARQEAYVIPSWRQDAENRATSYYGELGTKVLGGKITARATGSALNQVQVTVTGQVVSLVFGLRLTIHETAGGPVECFRPDLNGGQRCAG